MILSPKEILQKCDYYITYTYLTDKHEAEIFISWHKKTIRISYKDNQFHNDYTNQSIVCEPYAVESLALISLDHICKKYGFATKFVQYFIDKATTNSIYFNVDPTTMKESKDLRFMTTDVLLQGLLPDHVALAKNAPIWRGFQNIIEYYFNAKIN